MVGFRSQRIVMFLTIRPKKSLRELHWMEQPKVVKIRPRKACKYPNLRSIVWVSYDKVGVLYPGRLGSRSEARASDLRSYPGLWWNRIKLRLYEGKKVSTLRGSARLADLQGAFCVPPITLHVASTSLTCYCGSVHPISLFLFVVAILLLLPIEPTTPVPSRVASQWRERPSSYNGDHNSIEMAGAPPVGRRARTTRMTPANYVRTTLHIGAHSSSRLLVPPFGRRTRTTQTIPSVYVRTTLLFGAHSSSRLLVASVHRHLVIDHSVVELPEPHPSDLSAPRSASMLRSTSPRVASTSPKIGHRHVLFLRFGALRHICTTRHGQAYWNQPFEWPSAGTSLAERAHRPAYTFAVGARPPFAGPRAPCSRSSCRGSFLVILPGKEQAVLVKCFGFFVGEFVQYTRYRMGFSTYVDPSCASHNCCSLSAENSTATNLTQLGPLSDLS